MGTGTQERRNAILRVLDIHLESAQELARLRPHGGEAAQADEKIAALMRYETAPVMARAREADR
jgi:hypothetical protein